MAGSLSAGDAVAELLESSLAHLLPAMLRLSNEALACGLPADVYGGMQPQDGQWEQSGKLLSAVIGALPYLLGLLHTGERCVIKACMQL